MSETGVEEEPDWWERFFSLNHAVETAHELHEAAEVSRTAGTLGGSAKAFAGGAAHIGPASFLAPITLAGGIYDLVNGHSAIDRVKGGMETVSGAIGTTGLLGAGASALGGSSLLAGTGTGAALTSAGGAMGAGAAAAAPVAAVLGAGAGGLAIGDAWGGWIEGASRGRWGTDEGGRDQSVFDIAGDMGVSADQWVNNAVGGGTAGNILGTAAGGTTAALMGIGGAVAGSVDWLGNAAGLWD